MKIEINERMGTPVGVVSLLCLMQRYRLDYFAIFLATSEIIIRDCGYMDAIDHPLAERDEYFATLSKLLDGLRVSVEQMHGDKSLIAQIKRFSSDVAAGKDRRPQVIAASMKPIVLGIQEVLQNRFFMFMPEDQEKYYFNIEQFGNAVAMFPDALGDMLETSMCYACGRATACVFHAMRVAEFGLRHIAGQLKVKLKYRGKPMPITFATWETVLTAIENKRTKVRYQTKTNRRAARTIEYAAVAEHIAHLKDLWRNPVMHSNGIYDLQEALAVMNRVADLMKTIASSEYAPELKLDNVKVMKTLLLMTADIRSTI